MFRHTDYSCEEVGIQVPAGSIRPGETPEAAALREAREETGFAEGRAQARRDRVRHQPVPVPCPRRSGPVPALARHSSRSRPASAGSVDSRAVGTSAQAGRSPGSARPARNPRKDRPAPPKRT
ncbi:NUDIX domain-containing protein [Kitasatospora sp. NPDC056184]|uniref:NUDIX domain-containing protein n=1 Tax=Kitasatospora sp. NPDC056184 TaxID=3345738 RepID=UPI0035DED48C